MKRNNVLLAIALCLSSLLSLSCQEEEHVVKVTGVSLTPAYLSLNEGETGSLTAVVSPKEAENRVVIWIVGDGSIVSVNNGTVTALKAGATTVTAKTVDGGFTASCSVTVSAKPSESISISLSKSELTLSVGDTETLTATVTPADANDKTVTWSSSDSSIATVKDGVVTAIKEGTVTITAGIGSITATCMVTVVKKEIPVESVTLNKTQLDLKKGEVGTLVVTVKPDDATDKSVIWESSNSAVATVDNGKVTALTEGSSTITAKAGEKKATCNVTVKSATVISIDELTCAPNEILYTTKYKTVISLGTETGFGGNLVSNTYENGVGKLVFGNDVTTIPENAFSDCNSMLRIKLPNGVTKIGKKAFYKCSLLDDVTLPEGVTAIGANAFAECTSLTRVVFPRIKTWGEQVFKDCTGRLRYDGRIPSFNENAKTYGLFIGSKFTEVVLTEKTTQIPPYSFFQCTTLESLAFEGTISSVGSYAFYGCSSLSTSFVFPSGLSEIGSYAFSGCSSLQSLLLPDGLKSIGDSAFSNCTSLKELRTPRSVTSIGGRIAENCTFTWTVYPNASFTVGIFPPETDFLGSICVPADAESIPEGVFCYNFTMKGRFEGVYASKDGASLIYNNTLIAYLPQRGGFPTSGIKRIGYHSCQGVMRTYRFSYIVVPEGVEEIGKAAFDGHTNDFEELRLPSTLRLIEEAAFRNCWHVNIYFSSPVPQVDKNAFSNFDGKVYVPNGRYFEYAEALESRVNVHWYPDDAVDLGLSVKWSIRNVNAQTPLGNGSYYAWGETATKSIYNWTNYKWCNGSYDTLTKYNTKEAYGTVDNTTVLNLSDDAAYVFCGAGWRMPTEEEWTELRSNCTWTWTTLNGVNGYKVTSKKTGYADKSIFLPAAGIRDNTNLVNEGSYGYYWSSSLGSFHPHYAWRMYFNSYNVYGNSDGGSRCAGLPVRPVFGDFIPVESVSLNKSSLDIMVEETAQLAATVMPSTASDKSVSWTSDNPQVATVDSNGKVTGVSVGIATVTASSNNGSKSATCTVRVFPTYHESVDLGLSVKWATCNMGASSPEGYGNYYAWGETTTKKNYNWSTYKWRDSRGNLTKYNTLSSAGTVDNKTVLDRSDDVAHVYWGDGWRMPSEEDWTELMNNCTRTWTSLNGVKGWRITSKKAGYTDKSIFIPAAGNRSNTNYGRVGDGGFYWSSSLYTNFPGRAWSLYFDFTNFRMENLRERYYGFAVRPVYTR